MRRKLYFAYCTLQMWKDAWKCDEPYWFIRRLRTTRWAMTCILGGLVGVYLAYYLFN